MVSHPVSQDLSQRQFVIIGGGPAGLTAAHTLCQYDLKPRVYELRDRVGGISRTEEYRGYRFDMGGHRFFTKSAEVNAFWREILGDDFLRRPRLSRIYYNNRFFNYPLKPLNALKGLGPTESVHVLLSYLRWQLFPYSEEDNFEQWVTNRFGRRLFQIFFKSYTEKVWGISTTELGADWAAQRIKDLSLKTAILDMLRRSDGQIKTLIEEFHYPRRGPGMMWERCQEEVERMGGQVSLETPVTRIHRDGMHVTGVTVRRQGQEMWVPATDIISSLPLTILLQQLDPPPPADVLDAASHLHYRDFLTVCLIVDQPDLFPDNWIYIHEPAVRVGRIQNFKNWSADMVPDQSKTSLGLEYFCDEGDELWTMADTDLINLGSREIEAIRLADAADVEDGSVFRVNKAYPVYDSTYRDHLKTIRGWLNQFDNLQTIGRNGLHRYNNQDHTMLTGIQAVRNTLLGENVNLWSINGEAEYQEEFLVEEEAEVAAAARVLEEMMPTVLRRVDPVAHGVAFSVLATLFFLILTLVPILRNASAEERIFIELLNQYLPGYRVSFVGALLGAGYGCLLGFGGGWLYASLHNLLILAHLTLLERRADVQVLRRMDDYLA